MRLWGKIRRIAETNTSSSVLSLSPLFCCPKLPPHALPNPAAAMCVSDLCAAIFPPVPFSFPPPPPLRRKSAPHVQRGTRIQPPVFPAALRQTPSRDFSSSPMPSVVPASFVLFSACPLRGGNDGIRRLFAEGIYVQPPAEDSGFCCFGNAKYRSAMIRRTAVPPAGENDGIRRFSTCFFLKSVLL